MTIQAISPINNITPSRITDNEDTVTFTIPKQTAKTAAILASSMLALASMAKADVITNNNLNTQPAIQQITVKQQENNSSDDYYKALATILALIILTYGAATIANKKDIRILHKEIIN